jgi:hypothetical protein
MADWDPFAIPDFDDSVSSTPVALSNDDSKEVPKDVGPTGGDWEDPFLDPNDTSVGRAERAAKEEELARKAAEAYEASLASMKSLPSWVKGSKKPEREKAKASGYQGIRHITPSNGHKGHVAYLEDELSPVPPLPEAGLLKLEHIEAPPTLSIADDGWVLSDAEVQEDERRRLRLSLKEELQLRSVLPGAMAQGGMSAGDRSILRPAAGVVPEYAPIRHLGECAHPGCSANRDRNPQARPNFIEFVVRHISSKQDGISEIAYASL